MAYVIIVHMNDGSNGYSQGNWEYRITDGDALYYRAGFATREKARAAGERHMKQLENRQSAVDKGE